MVVLEKPCEGNGIKHRQPNETIILMHGIGHSLWNMAYIEKILRNKGYETLSFSYPSRKHDIETLSHWLSDKLEESEVWERADRVHFVSHSMGGLVSGFYLEKNKNAIPPGKMGRVIMLGTPHGGSEVADYLEKNFLYKLVFGPAGQELTTANRKVKKLNPWYELGIIAGTQNWIYPAGMLCIKEKNDGCVSVSSTRLEGMKDHITLPVLHGLMGWNAAVHRQILHFLEEGSFRHEQ